jgi:hypothetical protein
LMNTHPELQRKGAAYAINERTPDVHEIMAQQCVRLYIVHCKLLNALRTMV